MSVDKSIFEKISFIEKTQPKTPEQILEELKKQELSEVLQLISALTHVRIRRKLIEHAQSLGMQFAGYDKAGAPVYTKSALDPTPEGRNEDLSQVIQKFILEEIANSANIVGELELIPEGYEFHMEETELHSKPRFSLRHV